MAAGLMPEGTELRNPRGASEGLESATVPIPGRAGFSLSVSLRKQDDRDLVGRLKPTRRLIRHPRGRSG